MKKNNTLDLVLCSIPRMSIYYPPAAPALLKSSVEKNGYTCKTVDFVIDFHEKYFNSELWEKLDNWMVVFENNDPEALNIIKKEVSYWADELLKYNSNWIGISVFSYESHKVTKLLCLTLRQKDPNVKIVLGGAGVSDDANGFGEGLEEQGLIDAIIKGDGESSILKLLQNEYDGTFDRLENLNEWPYPKWTDYDLNLYKARKKEQNDISKNSKDIWQGYGNTWYRSDEILTLPIVGSRGCVRSCSFCDIPHLWPKYKSRTADNIAGEIIENYEKYGVQRFHFTDSLMNGNLKNFRELTQILADYREKNNADFTMTGQYIVRNFKSEKEEDYYNMRKAGFKILEVGVESGSEDVRYHLGKRFSNEDLDVFMERIHKHDISAVLLLIVGYPSETEKDFNETLEMLRRYKKYLASNTVVEACLGGTLRVENNTGLANDPHIIREKTSNGVFDDLLWTYKKNPELTLKERIKRRFVLMECAQDLGYMSPTNNQELLYLKSKWESFKDTQI